MNKRLAPFILILVLSLLLAACTSPSTTPTTSVPVTTPPGTTSTPVVTAAPTSPIKPTAPATTTPPVTPNVRYGGVLKIVLTGPVAAIGTLGSPVEYIGGMYGRVIAPALEYLFAYDADERFLPQLAESWEIAPDGKYLNIHLRKGVKFHDGSNLNAQLVKENFDMMKVATNAVTYASMFKNVASYDVIDEYTLRVNFSKFDSNFMVNMSLYPLFSTAAMKIPTTPENMAKDHIVGTGPFKFVSYARGEYVKYTKFDNYWQPGKPYLDGIELQQIDDPMTSLLYFKTGNAHLIFGITPKDALDLEQAGYTILGSSASMQFPIVPDGANPDSPFSNIKVRLALEYALDRKAIASIGRGYWQPAYQMAASTDARYIPDLPVREYNPAKAKQLLTEAGYPTGFKTTLVANSTFNRDVLVAVQAYLKAVGIDGAIDMAEAGRFSDLQTKGWKGLLFSGTPIVGNVQSMWNRFGSHTYPSMYRTTFQQKLDAAIAEPDYDKRLSLLKDMVRLMYEDVMVIPMYTSKDLSAADKRLQGDIKWTIGHPNMWYPANAWLSQ